ncbi:MAG: uridine kinase [Vallitaleaceae bacterium]|jgi:uridine kinase|nr:uridine kinase [Vallitaleaceae bacterium]
MEESIIIGIAGGTGSGKTTLVERLKRDLHDKVAALTHDDYYRAHDDLPIEERAKLNYDHPNAFDTEEMVADLKRLKSGYSIEVPSYDFVNHTRSTKKTLVMAKKVIIVEGILIFENKELRDMFDMKIFVDTDADVRFIRRMVRDVRERGRDLESVINQYLFTVKVMHDEFVEPSKKHADIIIPAGGKNIVAIDMMLDRIHNLLK